MKTPFLTLTCASLLLLGACQETNETGATAATEDTAVLVDRNQAPGAPAEGSVWDDLDWQVPVVQYDEVTNRDVEVRGNDNYGIYSLEEDILFDVDQSALKPTAKKHLDEIIASINKRYPNGKIGVFGFTDSTGSKDYNKELSEQRARSVSQYLSSTGQIDASRISVAGKGEKQPTATNATEAGRAKNRRVEIVAKK